MDDEDTFYPSDQELFASEDTNLSADLSSYSEDSGLSILDVDDRELKLINKIKKILTGVPPPPSVTIPTQDFNEVLRLWNASLESQSKASEQDLTSENERGKIATDILNVILETSWPESKNFQFFDINYNRNKSSEKLAILFDKYRERFVGYETSSFITINSPTKSMIKKSPKRDHHRRNLSCAIERKRYLANRKKTFSLESLRSLNKSSSILNNWKNQLIIDTKKKNKAIDDDDNKLRECTNRFTAACDKIGSRRALFGITAANKETSDSTKATTASSEGKSRYQFFHRTKTNKNKSPYKKKSVADANNNNNNNNTPKKEKTPIGRKRSVTQCYSSSSSFVSGERDENRNRHFPINEFSPFKKNDHIPKTEEQFSRSIIADVRTESANEKKSQQHDLTYSQKTKLLWAVSTALKTVGIGSNHKHFKLCGQRLFKHCKRIWLNNSGDHDTTDTKLSVSERMNVLACDHVRDIANLIENVPDFLSSQDSSSCDSFFTDQKFMSV